MKQNIHVMAIYGNDPGRKNQVLLQAAEAICGHKKLLFVDGSGNGRLALEVNAIAHLAGRGQDVAYRKVESKYLPTGDLNVRRIQIVDLSRLNGNCDLNAGLCAIADGYFSLPGETAAHHNTVVILDSAARYVRDCLFEDKRVEMVVAEPVYRPLSAPEWFGAIAMSQIVEKANQVMFFQSDDKATESIFRDLLATCPSTNTWSPPACKWTLMDLAEKCGYMVSQAEFRNAMPVIQATAPEVAYLVGSPANLDSAVKTLDEYTRKYTVGFDNFDALLNAKGGYWPSVACWTISSPDKMRNGEVCEWAWAYNIMQAARGDQRRMAF